MSIIEDSQLPAPGAEYPGDETAGRAGRPTRRKRGTTTPRTTSTTLRTVPLLAELPESQLDTLAAQAAWQSHGPGSVIVRQNGTDNDVYFVVSGYIKVIRGGSYAEDLEAGGQPERRQRLRHPVVVALLGPGNMAGEVASLLGGGRSSTLVALTPCQVVSIPGDAFLASLQCYPSLALAVAREMARRQVDASRQIELMRGDLRGRIHALIRHGRSIGLDVDAWLNITEIARMVGATRVAVSQVIGSKNTQRANRVPAGKEKIGKA